MQAVGAVKFYINGRSANNSFSRLERIADISLSEVFDTEFRDLRYIQLLILHEV